MLNDRILALSMISGLTVGEAVTEEKLNTLVKYILEDCIDFVNHSNKYSDVEQATNRIKELIKLNYEI